VSWERNLLKESYAREDGHEPLLKKWCFFFFYYIAVVSNNL